MRLGPLATIGAALPNAIAMKAARPDAPVVLITGDGSFGFYIAEIDTAVRHKLPFVIIVGNDGAWGLEKELQTVVGRTVACELRQTRYDLVVKGFGGDGETVDSPQQIPAAMDRGFASPVPYCININVRGAASPFAEWQLAGKKK
jgi:acetolactate synthase-1/2/3 large subunit